MAWRVLRREPGQPWMGVNHKRIQRLWREEGLRRPARTRKRRRVTPDTAERLRATHPNHVWAIDFQFDETADGRRLEGSTLQKHYSLMTGLKKEKRPGSPGRSQSISYQELQRVMG